MAFNGTLITVGSYTIPMGIIKIESYSVTYSTLDLDSYRDTNGLLHRNALAHKCGKVTFSTPKMYSSQLAEVMNNIRGQYSNATEKKVTCTYFVPELDDYVTQEMYVPDITCKIVQNSPYGLIYDETEISFIAY